MHGDVRCDPGREKSKCWFSYIDIRDFVSVRDGSLDKEKRRMGERGISDSAVIPRVCFDS